MRDTPSAVAEDSGETPSASLSGSHPWHRVRRPALRWSGVILAGLLGGYLGWSIAPGANATVGPLAIHLNLEISPHGGSVLDLPPFGQVEFASHRGPLGVQASVVSVDERAAAQLVGSGDSLDQIAAGAPSVIRNAVIRAALLAALCTLTGAALVCWALSRRLRRVGQSVLMAMVPLVVSGLVAGFTFNPGAARQPEFTGLLSRAPYLAGQGRDMLNRLQSYRSGIADMVTAVSTVYARSEALPVLPKDQRLITILHISDVHLNPQAYDLTERLIGQFRADAVVDTGDVTTWGTAAESRTLDRIGELGVPYVFVRGNHDSRTTADYVASQDGARVLEGRTAEVAGLRFAGIGDASFTPDGASDAGSLSSPEVAGVTARKLAGVVEAGSRRDRPVDVALIHNAAHPEALFGKVPLILSGHTHTRRTYLDPQSRTRVMVEGSTGGAGLTSGAVENLENARPAPLEATLLYFSPTSGTERPRLLAWDDVTVGGLGLSSVTVARTMADAPSSAQDSPTPSGSATSTEEVGTGSGR